MKTILVLSKQQFAELPADPNAVALRIVNPDGSGHAPVPCYGEDLQLEFSDVEHAYGREEPINARQAYNIVTFLNANKDKDRFVFHCEYGQSRSHTCALFFAQEILDDIALSSLLASAQGKSINYALWNALHVAHLRLQRIVYGAESPVREKRKVIIVGAPGISTEAATMVACLDACAALSCREEDRTSFEVKWDKRVHSASFATFEQPKKFHHILNKKHLLKQTKGRRR